MDDLQKPLGVVVHHDSNLVAFHSQHHVLGIGEGVQAFGGKVLPKSVIIYSLTCAGSKDTGAAGEDQARLKKLIIGRLT